MVIDDGDAADWSLAPAVSLAARSPSIPLPRISPHLMDQLIDVVCPAATMRTLHGIHIPIPPLSVLSGTPFLCPPHPMWVHVGDAHRYGYAPPAPTQWSPCRSRDNSRVFACGGGASAFCSRHDAS